MGRKLLPISLLQALLDPGTGLLVNERVLNCPPQISPPLMLVLFDEIGWAVDDEPTEVVASLWGHPASELWRSGGQMILQRLLECDLLSRLCRACMQELQDSFRFTQHLLIAPVYRDVTAGRPDTDQAAQPAARKAKAKVRCRLFQLLL